MLKYLILSSEEEAKTRSHTEALRRGCSADAVTQYWWAWTGPILQLEDNDTAGLTDAEAAQLVDTLPVSP